MIIDGNSFLLGFAIGGWTFWIIYIVSKVCEVKKSKS